MAPLLDHCSVSCIEQVRCLVPLDEYSAVTHGPLGAGRPHVGPHVGPLGPSGPRGPPPPPPPPPPPLGPPHGGPPSGPPSVDGASPPSMAVGDALGLMARCVADGTLLHPGQAMASIPADAVRAISIARAGATADGLLIELSTDAMHRWGIPAPHETLRPAVMRFWRKLLKAANDKGGPPPCPTRALHLLLT